MKGNDIWNGDKVTTYTNYQIHLGCRWRPFLFTKDERGLGKMARKDRAAVSNKAPIRRVVVPNQIALDG